MVAQPDFELQGDAVIDEDSLQDDVDEISFEMMGDSAQIQDAQELNEERNEKLGVVSRGLATAATFFIEIAAVLGLILAALVSLAGIFDISFSDVRNGIVNVLDTLINSIEDLVPTNTKQTKSFITGALDPTNPGIPGLRPQDTVGGRLIGDFLKDQNISLDANILTSRDQMLGDSTQQDKSADKQNQNIFNWGS